MKIAVLKEKCLTCLSYVSTAPNVDIPTDSESVTHRGSSHYVRNFLLVKVGQWYLKHIRVEKYVR